MATHKISLPAFAEMISESMHVQIKNTIYKKLREDFDPLLEQAAKDIANNLKGKVEMYDDFINGPKILITINGEKIDFGT